MKDLRVALVSSAYNESGCITEFLAEARRRLIDLLGKYKSISSFEICIANNCSTDNTLDLLLAAKQHVPELRVFDNLVNYGYDVSILNSLKHATADIILVMCSDFEDPFDVAFLMLERYLNQPFLSKDSILAVKHIKLPLVFGMNRRIYYLISGFGSRSSAITGYHGFGVYSKGSIERALDYSTSVAPNVRKALLWGSPQYQTFIYQKGQRAGGKSSYSLFSYYQEAFSQIFSLPSLSSRLAIRLSVVFISFSIITGFFFLANFFAGIMHFPNGTTTIIMLLLISTCINLVILSLLARQLENIVMPNMLNVLASREL